MQTIFLEKTLANLKATRKQIKKKAFFSKKLSDIFEKKIFLFKF